MDDLIGRLVSDVGVDRPAAETAIRVILDFLPKKDPPTKYNCCWRSSPELKP
jgi:hypothetical protein